MFKHVGSFVTKNRIWIILAWVVLAAFMFFSAPSLNDVGIQDYSTFLHNSDTESTRAGELMQKYFPGTGSASSVSLIFCDEKGLSDSDLTYGQQVRD
ncbi:MAG: hypothetical protein PHU23_17060, partial [Dehalococcoidales bacterium]|nr:hypothetical protein [Dehalococcoidales bacterium]